MYRQQHMYIGSADIAHHYKVWEKKLWNGEAVCQPPGNSTGRRLVVFHFAVAEKATV